MKRTARALKAVGFAVVLLGSALAIACGGGATEAKSNDSASQAPAQPQLVANKLFVDVDVVRGPENMTAEEKARKSCVQASRIPLGGQVVWRVRISDPATGALLDDKALATVVATLPDGQTFTMKYGPHPKDPPGEAFWTTSFKVPVDYPTGQLDYKVVATDKEGRKGEFRQIMSVPSAVLTIVDSEPLVTNGVAGDTFARR